jgi:hypothetical protein
MSSRFVHDRGRGYTYRSNNSAERVHMYPSRNGTRRWPTDRAHPTMQTLGSYGPILHPALKTVPPQKESHRNYEMPLCGNTGVALRGWSHSHLSPTNTPLSCWQVWFHTCRAQLGPNPTLSEVECTKVKD